FRSPLCQRGRKTVAVNALDHRSRTRPASLWSPSSGQRNSTGYRATAFSPVLAGAESVPVKRSKSMSMSMSMNRSGSKRDRSIPRRPLLWLAAALLFTLPPMFGSLPSWVPLLFLIALAAKFWMEPKGYRLRSLVWKLVLVALILSLLFFSYGSLRGIEPGVSLIVMLTSVKILEAHTAREFHIMIMVAWVLCLCGFFLSQNLAIALCLLIAFTLLLVALIQFHRGSSS